MPKVQIFSKGKTEERNEDFFGYNESNFVIADGSTDKSGRTYDGKTGGEVVSRLVVEAALSSTLNGIELIGFLNDKIAQTYGDLKITNEVKDPKFRFTCGCVIARVVGELLIITYVGDLGFRINGKNVYREAKQVDLDHAEERARYVNETGDVEGSRQHILPLILKQFEYQNNPDHQLGYGVVDGTATPSKFIKIFEYSVKQVRSLELFTDGYFAVPQGTSIADWERSFEEVERVDPDKYKTYKSTKSKDDRTVAIIEF